LELLAVRVNPRVCPSTLALLPKVPLAWNGVGKLGGAGVEKHFCVGKLGAEDDPLPEPPEAADFAMLPRLCNLPMTLVSGLSGPLPELSELNGLPEGSPLGGVRLNEVGAALSVVAPSSPRVRRAAPPKAPTAIESLLIFPLIFHLLVLVSRAEPGTLSLISPCAPRELLRRLC
jgi:hypothetical protein